MSFLFEVSTGVKNLKIPVTAKIRVFEDIDKSVEYAKMCEKAGIAVNKFFPISRIFIIFSFFSDSPSLN
jgi:hypothetical protein